MRQRRIGLTLRILEAYNVCLWHRTAIATVHLIPLMTNTEQHGTALWSLLTRNSDSSTP